MSGRKCSVRFARALGLLTAVIVLAGCSAPHTLDVRLTSAADGPVATIRDQSGWIRLASVPEPAADDPGMDGRALPTLVNPRGITNRLLLTWAATPCMEWTVITFTAEPPPELTIALDPGCAENGPVVRYQVEMLIDRDQPAEAITLRMTTAAP